MRSLFSVVSIVFMGLIGCGHQASPSADHGAVAGSIAQIAPAQTCPDICGDGTLCQLPDGACTEVCNPCYCTREGGTVVDACPQGGSAQNVLQMLGPEVLAAGDGDRAR